MTVQEIMAELEAKGDAQIKSIFLRHGAKEPLFGVRVGDMKPIQKKIKKNYQLAKDLYATGNADAMYLAGLIADDTKMTKKDLELWVEQATSPMSSEYAVPWVAAGSLCGFELALQWIDSSQAHIAVAGWNTLSSLVALKPDSELDIVTLRNLLSRVRQTIHQSTDRVRYVMNGFVIAIGSYVSELSNEAIETAQKIGKVKVNMNGTACKVPDAAEYIDKVKDKGKIGVKRKEVKC